MMKRGMSFGREESFWSLSIVDGVGGKSHLWGGVGGKFTIRSERSSGTKSDIRAEKVG